MAIAECPSHNPSFIQPQSISSWFTKVQSGIMVFDFSQLWGQFCYRKFLCSLLSVHGINISNMLNCLKMVCKCWCCCHRSLDHHHCCHHLDLSFSDNCRVWEGQTPLSRLQHSQVPASPMTPMTPTGPPSLCHYCLMIPDWSCPHSVYLLIGVCVCSDQQGFGNPCGYTGKG